MVSKYTYEHQKHMLLTLSLPKGIYCAIIALISKCMCSMYLIIKIMDINFMEVQKCLKKNNYKINKGKR